uniref:Uncharacterized protein n=1 Tax=Tanacetum cinerariifolium TaxID=118510 RepID=A0A699GFW3_TANCI|nr:hypothetical protein [Tanacetum cinerariifolium]
MDPKSLFDAIETRFDGNEAIKKTQKTLLKQMYENFSATSTKSLDSILTGFRSFTNEVYTAYGVSTANTQSSTASTQVSTASSQTSTANLSDATVYAFLANQSNGSQLVHKDLEQIHEDDLEDIDLKWQLALLSMKAKRGPRNQDSRNRYQDSSRRTVNVEETPPKAMVAIDGVGFDWSVMADDEVPTNMALIHFLDSESCGTESKNASEDIRNELKEYPNAPLVKDRVSDNKDSSVESPIVVEKKTDVPTIAKVEFVRPKQQEKSANCNYHQREMVVSRNNNTKLNYNNSTRKTHPNAHRSMAPRSVLIKTGLRPLNTARPVNTAHLKTTVNSAIPMSRFSKSAQSAVKQSSMVEFGEMIKYHLTAGLTTVINIEKIGSSSTSQNPQNVAFVSSNSTNSTNEADNTAYGVINAHIQEDLEQIDPDNLEEIDLHWAMLTIKARRHFARERRAPKNQENRGSEYGRKTMPVENPIKNALIAQDRIRGYDWSYQAEEEHPTNYALMVLTSSGSSSSLDSESRSDKVKTILGYKATSPAIEDFMNSSKMIENRENVKSRSDKGYHAVPPPYTGNYIPPKPDLMFIDEQVKSEFVDVVSNVLSSVVNTVESKVKSVDVKNKGVYNTVETKLVKKNNFSPPIIEDWNSDDESEVEFEPKVEVKTVRPSIEKMKFVKTAMEKVEKVETPKQHKHYPRGNQRN